MEWAFGVALAIGVYLWARHHEAQKRERRELRVFRHREWFSRDDGKIGTLTW